MKHKYLFLLLLLYSCTNDANNHDDHKFTGNFPPPTELSGSVIFENEYAFTVLSKIDSLIFVSTQQEPFIRIYDTQYNRISSFGKSGRGPGEYMDLAIVRDGIATDSLIRFFTYDSPQRRWSDLILYKETDSINASTDNEFLLPAELSGTRDIFYIDDETLIGIYDDHFYKILDETRGGFFYYPAEERFETFPLFNVRTEPYEVTAATNINARASAISPNRKKLAAVMWHYPIIEIIDTSTREYSKFHLKSALPAEVFDTESFHKKNITEYYSYIQATNDYIYLMYSGQKSSERHLYETYIQVLNWEAEPIAQYKIPAEYALFLFIVNEDKKAFYGLSYHNDSIYKFNYN